MGDLAQVGAKAAVYVGMVLILGAGVFVRWIARGVDERISWRRLRAGAWAGAVLLVFGSALDVVDTIARAMGSVDPSLVVTYVLQTQQGNAVLARLGIVVLLVLLGLWRRRPVAADRAAFVVLGGGLLLTVSLVAHAAATPGAAPLPMDFLHIAGVTGWGGALIYGAWVVPWRAFAAGDAGAARLVARLSGIGLASAFVVPATGIYAALLHLWGPRALVDTAYGRALLVKLAVVAAVACVAAANRWLVVPSLTRGTPAAVLGRLIRIESLLLFGVLGVTSVLVTEAPAETAPMLSGPLSISQTAGPWAVSGTLTPQGPGRFALALTIRGGEPPRGAIPVALTMLDMEMPPVRATIAPVGGGAYRGTFALPMTGRWQLAVPLGGGLVQVPIQTRDAAFAASGLGPWGAVLPGAALGALGLGLGVVGLQRIGAGRRGSWPVLAAGAALVVAGVAAAAHAAQ